jgi:hypothetical protein
VRALICPASNYNEVVLAMHLFPSSRRLFQRKLPPPMNLFSAWRHFALAMGVAPALYLFNFTSLRAEYDACATCPVYEREAPSWVFRRSTYSHDPYTGARVAQYMRTPPVEPLDDPRMVTSRYRRSRTNLRGIDGWIDTYYEVQAWGNGRGGVDAEWERFHDAWKESYLTGGFYNQGQGFSPWAPGWGGLPGFGFPGFGVNPGFGFPGWNGFPQHGGWHGGHGQHDGGQHVDDFDSKND